MADYLAILPEILLVVLAFVILVVDLRLKEDNKGPLAWLTFVGFVVIFFMTIFFARPDGDGGAIWGGMLRHDWLAFVFRLAFISGAAITVIFALDWDALRSRGEFYILLVISTLGMTLMGASGDLIMLFLAIETASIPLYVMAGFLRDDEKSTEAGFKYLLFGAMTSSVMLYGFSLLYGFTGTTDIYALSSGLMAEGMTIPVFGAIVLMLVGFGFKISMFPFQFWAPDVYEGAPTPVAGFLSTASKAAGFSVIVRVLFIAFPAMIGQWQTLVAVMAAVTMTLGNTVALRQTNIKRMLAYSSIAQAGYILLGVAAGTELGARAVVYYAIVYLLTNLAAFGFVSIYYRQTGSDEIADYAGLSRRNPILAFGMMFTFLSLGGIPPMGGFFAKVLVFAAAMEVGLVWLAVVGVINAVIGLYYYMTVLKVVYLYRQEGDEEPLLVDRAQSLTLTFCVVTVTLLGIIMAPLLEWSSAAAAALF